MGDLESQSTTTNVLVKSTPVINHHQQEHTHLPDIVTKLKLPLPPPPPPPPPSLLTKLHAGYFSICLSLGSQALSWKALSEHTIYPQPLHHVFAMFPSTAFRLLWYLSLSSLLILSLLYLLRCIFHFQLVKSEFLHHVGVNYLFTPWISWLLVLKSTPIISPNDISYQFLWWAFVTPIVILDVKIYGQWFTTEKRFLSMVANPTSQISVIGNLVGAWTAAQMGWIESAVCLFTLGMIHYLVVFTTLYQRLSSSEHLPVRLRPTLFLFVAAPSMASLAWGSISGDFGTPSKMLFFLSLFLFTSLVSSPIYPKRQ